MALTPQPYSVPSWCREALRHPPKHGRFPLANLPTPLHRILPKNSSSNRSKIDPSSSQLSSIIPAIHSTLWIKRDDCTSGVELGGNKVRKLEFLLAEAVALKCDAVVTIGGLQSNHARATAAAARLLQLEPHVLLRDGRARDADNDDVGLVGNVLFHRLLGAHIYTCTPGEYGRVGSEALVARLCAKLQQTQDRRPYAIPVGGSNALGTWGYIQAVDELLSQWKEAAPIDCIVVACGSGGTAAGITLGVALAKQKKCPGFSDRTMVHAIGVCDDEEYFYNHIANIATEMGLVIPEHGGTVSEFLHQHLVMHQGKGRGYAQSTQEEYDFIVQFARDTGIVLDPVYTGKALYNFLRAVEQNPQPYANQNILFWHTGGSLGLFDKSEEMKDLLLDNSPCHRLDVYGKGDGFAI